jgi:hypothetical protein
MTKSSQKTRVARAKKIAKQLSKKNNTVRTIALLFNKGFSQKEIIAAGFKRNTTYCQTNPYKLLRHLSK